MVSFVIFLLGVLALGPRVVLSSTFKFSFSEVVQCAPITISFSGNSSTIPTSLTLTVLPFNSCPISIPIPDARLVLTGGVYVTFLPFTAGTNFIASLDGPTGASVAKVSDVIRVLPSPTSNSTCLSTSDENPAMPYALVGGLSQCEDISIMYNKSIVVGVPSVRLYHPTGASFFLNQTSDDYLTGIGNYEMDFARGKEVVLLISDGGDNSQTTGLLTVNGDTSSSPDCIMKTSMNDNMIMDIKNNTSPAISEAVIIGCSVGGAVIILVATCMAFFVCMERRRRRRLRIAFQFDPSLMGPTEPTNQPEKGTPPPEKNPPSGAVSNPLYTSQNFLSPKKRSLRASLASWAQVVPEDQRYSSNQGSPVSQKRRSNDRLSINSLDIEGMLNMATDHFQRSSKQLDPLPFSPNHSPSAAPLRIPFVPRPLLARTHFRDPSDVPADPTSMTFSSYSVNPFSDKEIVLQSPLVQSSAQNSLALSPSPSISRPAGVVTGLPSSPRNGRRASPYRPPNERQYGSEGR